MKICKKIVATVLCIVLVSGMMAILPVSANAAETNTSQSEASISNKDMSVTGANSLGNMLADEYEKSADKNENNGYGIYDIEVEGKTAQVEMQAKADARLIVTVFDEEGKTMIGSGMTEVSSGDKLVEVTLETETMPQYFMLRAFMMDKEENTPLCKQFESNKYTQKMQEFLAKTTDDFDKDKVLNLDSKKDENFLVYNDDTIIINNDDENKNVVKSANDESKKYVIENIDDSISGLKEGDIFSYDSGDGNLLIIKVKSISIDGKTATIYGDEINPEDAFDYIKIDAKQGAEETSVDNSKLDEGVEYAGEDAQKRSPKDKLPTGLTLADIDGTLGTSLEYKINKNNSDKKINGKVGVKIEADIKFYYDAHLFEDDELEISAVIKYELTVGIELELKNKQEIKIPLGRIEISPWPGLFVRLTPALVLEGKVKFNLQVKVKGQVGFGFEYGQAVDKTKAPTIDSEFKMTGELFVGVSLAPDIALLGDLAKAGFDARAGIKLKAEIKYSTEEEKDEIHLCNSCIDGDIFFAIKLKFSFSLLDNKNLTWNFDMLEFEWKLGDFYYSFDTGRFAFSSCPNYKYKQNLTLLDKNRKPIVDATVSGETIDKTVTDSKGKTTFYATTGKVELKIKKDGKEVVRYHYIDHAGQFTYVIDFDKPEGSVRGSSGGNGSVVQKQRGIVETGQCGENAFYTWYRDGMLEISGTGAIKDYSDNIYSTNYKANPWFDNFVQNHYGPKPKINSVIIHEGITRIGAYAFSDCWSICNVSIPDSVCEIGDGAFRNCISLFSIDLSTPSLLSIGKYGFSGCNSLVNVYLSSSLISIGEYGFCWCNSLLEIQLPTSLSSIGKYGFGYCSSLKEIILPPKILIINEGLLYNCTSLNSIQISNTTTEIKNEAFCNCISIQSVTVPNSVKRLEGDVFKNCSSLKNIKLSTALEYIGGNVFADCTALESIRIPDSVNEVGGTLFYRCSSLKTVDFGKSDPKGAFAIFGFNFMECDALTQILVSDDNPGYCSIDGNLYSKFGDKLVLKKYAGGKSDKTYTTIDDVVGIGNEAFDSCPYLEKVVLNDNVTYISDYAFSSCKNLKEIILSNNIKAIGNGVFYCCESLETINIPYNVEKLKSNSFWRCYNLKSINVDINNKYYCSVDGNIFNSDKSKLVYYSIGKTQNSFTIPDSVTNIGEGAFEYCKNLETIIIPNSVINIEKNAFEYCENLNNIVIPKSMSKIEESAFNGCYKLKNVYYEGSEEEWKSISIENSNLKLTSATIHYNSTGVDDNGKSGKLLTFASAKKANSALAPKNIEKKVKLLTAGNGEPESFKRSNLVPGTEAILMVIKGSENAAELNPASLMYIAQGIVGENGEASFEVGQGFGEENWVAYIFGKCNHSESDWTVSKEAAVGEEGLKIKTCEYCGIVLDTEIIEPTQQPSDTISTESTAPITEDTTPTSTNPAETEPFVTEPITHPVLTDPIATDPFVTEPITPPVVTDPTQPSVPKPTLPKVTTKKNNPIKVSVKTKTVKLKKLKKKAQKVKAITVKNNVGKVSYKLVKSGITKKIRKLVKINSKGVITIKKWKKAKKGTYKIKVKVTAAGNKNYNAKAITKSVKVKVK